MKKTILIFALAAGLILAGQAMAQDRGPRMDRHHPRGGPDIGLQVMEHLGKAMRRLDLSVDQKISIREEFGGFRETVAPLVRELHAGRMNLRDVVTAGEYDAEAAAEIAGQQGQLTSEITLLVSETVAGVMAHLNDDQRAELQAMGEERQAHRMERHEKFKAHREERREAREGRNPEGN